jgi:hypothetical protein
MVSKVSEGRMLIRNLARRLGRKALGEVATAALPDTILGSWGGTEGLSLANSMDRMRVEARAGL